MSGTSKIKRDNERIKLNGEVFTPPQLVCDMLDKLPKETWYKGKTFLDPACGNGNFLVEILERKLKRKHGPLDALRTIYGIELMADNVEECRIRILKIIATHEEVTAEHIQVVLTNIVCADALKYDMEFEEQKKPNYSETRKWINRVFRYAPESL